MKNIQFVKMVGRIQLVLSVLLAIACVSVYSAYRSSLGELSRSLADSILSASGVITEIAQTIKTRQDLLDDATRTLLANRRLVEEVQRSAETQGGLLPMYASNMKYVSAMATDLGNTITELGGRLFFTVPSGGMHLDGIKPVFDYITPFENQAKALQEHGKKIKEFSIILEAIAGTLTNDAPRIQAEFIESCKQVVNLLDETAKATAALKSEDLPKAMTNLEATSKNLRQASDRAKGIDQFVTSLLIAGLVLACLCACNSFAVLQLATLIKQRPEALVDTP